MYVPITICCCAVWFDVLFGNSVCVFKNNSFSSLLISSFMKTVSFVRFYFSALNLVKMGLTPHLQTPQSTINTQRTNSVVRVFAPTIITRTYPLRFQANICWWRGRIFVRHSLSFSPCGEVESTRQIIIDWDRTWLKKSNFTSESIFLFLHFLDTLNVHRRRNHISMNMVKWWWHSYWYLCACTTRS